MRSTRSQARHPVRRTILLSSSSRSSSRRARMSPRARRRRPLREVHQTLKFQSALPHSWCRRWRELSRALRRSLVMERSSSRSLGRVIRLEFAVRIWTHWLTEPHVYSDLDVFPFRFILISMYHTCIPPTLFQNTGLFDQRLWSDARLFLRDVDINMVNPHANYVGRETLFLVGTLQGTDGSR